MRVTALWLAFKRSGQMDRRRDRSRRGIDRVSRVHRQSLDPYFAFGLHGVSSLL
jgi:hypothetical protein